MDFSITALPDRFCNPQFQELLVLKVESYKFGSETHNPEIFVIFRTKVMEAYQDPNLPAIAPIDSHAADAETEEHGLTNK